MASALHDEIHRRLLTTELPPRAMDLIDRALTGEPLDGDPLPARLTPMAPPRPLRAWINRIGVTGFRGIGPTQGLDLQPGPGLTIIVGRNGSGKSSFAEA